MNTIAQPHDNQWQLMDTIGALVSLVSIVSLSTVVYHMSRHYTDKRIIEARSHSNKVPTDSTGFTIESRMPFYSFKNMPIGSPNPKFTASLEQSPEGLVHFDLKLTNGNWLYLSWDGQNPPSVYTGEKEKNKAQ